MNLADKRQLQRLRVWDLPTRVFHGLLILSICGAVVTALAGALEWHVRCGLASGALLGFRLVWGLIGGRWSRFRHFRVSPASVWRYVRRRTRPDDAAELGHSPIGALAILAMLAVLLAQVATGLVADDEVATTGPLARFVPDGVTAAATAWHKGAGQWLIYGLVASHLVAVLVYTLRGRGIVAAMWHGDKRVPAQTLGPASHDGWLNRLVALAVLAAFAAGAIWLSRL